MKKISFVFLCFLLCCNVFCAEKVRKQLADGKYRFFDKTNEVRYDNRGNKVYENKQGKEYNFEYDENNNLIKDDDYSYNYDFNGNLLSKYNLYNGYVAEEYKYDNSGRKIEYKFKYDYYSDISTYFYEYDSAGRLCGITMEGRDIEAIFDYDENGNLIYEDNPFALDSYGETYRKIYIYEYDEKNNLVAKIDSGNNEIKYEYDDRNNLICEKSENYYDNVYYEYDDLNRLVSRKNYDGDVKESYKYNDKGLISEETQGYYNYYYFYDDNGLLKNKTVKSGEFYNVDGYEYVYEYEFHENGQIAKVTEFKYAQDFVR